MVDLASPAPSPERVGLPAPIRACLFDLDGVLTDTASVHDRAWKQMFDEFLAERSVTEGQLFRPFDPARDYQDYVDGRPRPDGVRCFLASRGITLPDGSPEDPPNANTVHGLGNRKNVLLLEIIATDGITPYPGSLRYVQAARQAGLRTAVVSSSANTRQVLDAAGMESLFDEGVDGVTIEREHLPGKPAPDTFLEAARRLGVHPDQAAVFEDALAGVQAGRAGHFGLVVGVDRVQHGEALRSHGADIVVRDLAELIGPGQDGEPNAGRGARP